MAFRRLPRPSSPLTAKASTVCAYSLDHITRSRLRVAEPTLLRVAPNQVLRLLPQRHISELAPPDPVARSRLRSEPRRLLRPKLSKNTTRTSTSGRIDAFSMLSIQNAQMRRRQGSARARQMVAASIVGRANGGLLQWWAAPMVGCSNGGLLQWWAAPMVGCSNGGSGRTRTTDLTLIRGAL